MMGGYSWVTLATNDSYSLGALVLAHSLKQVGTKQHLSVLITPGVTNAMRSKLSEVFNVVQEVNVLDSKDEANLRLLKRPELGVTFTKLHCWRLTQFDKCVFLDADTLVLENCDELFEREELSAAPDIGWPDCFNSGVFVYRPSNETYEKLIEFALEKGSFDGGDQGLLNLYFFDWAHKDISKHLPFIYNMASTACYSYLPAFKQFGAMAKIIHFIGSSKPWLQYFDTETKQVHPSQGYDHLKMILQHWWDIFCSMIHPCLSPDMTPSHTDTAHGSPYSYPSDNIYSSNFHDDPYYKQIDTSQSIFNHAELCQNVWDPWEEYDSRQFQNEPVLVETCYHTTENNPYHQENHIHLNNHHETYHSNTDLHDSEVQNYSNQTYQEPQIYNPPQTNQHPDQIVSTDNQSSFIRDTHNFSVDNLHHCYSSEFQAPESSSSHPDSCQPPAQSHNQSRSHFIQVNNHISQHEQKLLESHNTNACTDADHCHYSHPQIPSQTYSYPQSQPVAHIESSTTSPQEAFTMSQTPSFNEHELSECVTATVSSDISKGDKENDAGIAGAFAKLTLGQPRTAEQLALDDHLRRQGWEVGKIDYLGRDSFDNIWNKICETLSSAPTLPEQKTKDPSSSSSEVKELEQSLTEVKTDIEESSESISPTQVISLSTTDLGITSEALSKQTPNLPPTEHSPLLPPPDLSKSSTQSQPALEHPETMSDTKQPSQQVAAESKLVAESEQIVKGGFKPNFEPSIAVSESSKPVSELQKTIVEPPTPVTEPATPDTELPKAVTELPTPVTKPPTPVTKPPTPVTEPLTPVTEPLTPSTEPTKPVAESQKPVTEPPKPVTEPPKPVAELPKTVAEPPKPVAEPPQPVAEPPNPVAEPPKPVAEPPKPVAKPPKPVAEPPKPIAEPPKPVAEPPKPFVESPKPVVESPKPVAESPKPVVEYPRTVAEPPKTVAELPETVAEPPQSPTGISPPVAESPKPVTEGSKLALETPKSGTEPTNTTAESPKIISEPQKSLTESLKPRTEPSKSTAKSVGEQSKPVGEQSKPFQAEKSVSEGCSVKSKQTSSGESKDSRKSKGIPKTQVTETTPPTSPVWPQTKQALNVDTSIPDTPPPAAQESATAGPTPPPRKGSSGTKKTASKTKK